MSKEKSRLPGWGEEAVLAGLREGHSLAAVCREYAGTASPRTLSRDVTRWRRKNSAFDAEYRDIMESRHSASLFDRKNGGGHQPKELTNPDWRQEFCQALFDTGSRLKAAEASPYVYDTLYKMLTPRYEEYDATFAEMVHKTEMRLCAEMEETFVTGIRDDNVEALDRVKIAEKFLQRRDPDRWSRRVEVAHSGTVKHEHRLAGNREERLEQLLEEQRQFYLESKPVAALTDGKQGGEAVEVLDAEYVEVPANA